VVPAADRSERARYARPYGIMKLYVGFIIAVHMQASTVPTLHFLVCTVEQPLESAGS
jgi:hypothetical protein